MTIGLTINDLQDQPITLTNVSFYDKNPMVAGSSNWDSTATAFAVTQTDEVGYTSISFSVGAEIDAIYLYIKSLYFPSPVIIPVTSSTISLTLHPSGYDTSKSALRATTAATPWRYNTSSNIWVLGDFDTKGYPTYLVGRDTYTSSFIKAVSNSLPENSNLVTSRSDLFKDGSTSNVATNAASNIWVSFLAEGAGYQNVMGYFYYPTGTPPNSASAISKRIIIFPNASDQTGSSNGTGSMVIGDKVKLMFYDESTATWTDVFPAGYTIGWFVISNGFTVGTSNKGISTTATTFYSIPSLNSDKTQHNIIFFDETSQTAVIGFEDLPMSYADKDYNDVVFSFSASPISAINTSNLPLLTVASKTDTDGDGVIDSNDAYPTDAQRAFDVYYPTSGTGSLLFEDSWPSLGDYDFNDLVIGYKYHLVTNSYGAIKDVKATYSVKAVGATYRNGFAIQFGTGPGNVESVSGQRNVSGSTLFTVNSAGYEMGQSYAVIPVFPDAHQLFGYSTPTMINTVSTGTRVNYQNIDLQVSFATPVRVSALGSPPYNAFIIINKDRGREVHLAGNPPTSKANSAYFGTSDDLTNGTTIFYRNKSNYPWALNIPTNFLYPMESEPIIDAYLKYSNWVTSSGVSNADWYSNTSSGYRNSSKIYQ